MATTADLFDQALQYHRAGALGQAELLYRQIIQTDSSHADAHHLLGILAHKTGHAEQALALVRHAIALEPLAPVYHFNLGNILTTLKQVPEAITSYRQALLLDPHYADALTNLGIALRDQKQLPEAVVCFQQALRIDPHHAGAHNNLGVAFKDMGQLAEAITHYQEALRIDPRLPDVLDNLGAALMILGLRQEALEQYEQVLRVNPLHGRALASRSLLRLLEGDFARGWPEYEYRWTQLGCMARHQEKPRWDGSSLAGTTILIHAEQGLGDTIQFACYIPLVKRHGGTVLFECQPSLVALLTGMPGVDQLIAAGAPTPAYDVQAPLLSLPGIFGTTLETIPAPVPYLHANPELVKEWHQALASPAGLKIGIIWQGSINHTGDRYRSLPLSQFECLAKVKGVQLVSLQVGAGTEQLSTATFPVLDLGSRFEPSSMEDLAAVLKNLDLVVTVDTAVAHVGVRLGVPVWVALTFGPDWRWLLEREDSPWYPTMRLFRQRRFGDWGDVFERISADVSKHNKLTT